MARSIRAVAGVLSALCVLSLPAISPALATGSANTHWYAHCTSARGKRPSDTAVRSSFHRAHCPAGSGGGHKRKHQHGARHLFFKARHGRCRDAGLAPSPWNLEMVRAATLCLIDRERAADGEQPLHWNDRLIRAAQAHTESMAFGGYFAHVGPGGETPLSRMRRTGYIYNSSIGFEVGENIAWGSLWLGTPRAIVAAWMASPGHRANILDRRFRDTGIGVSGHLGSLAEGQTGGMYTQDFGVIDAR